MEEHTLIYIILTLFALNVVGISGMWSGIDKLRNQLEDVSQRLTVIETRCKLLCMESNYDH